MAVTKPKTCGIGFGTGWQMRFEKREEAVGKAEGWQRNSWQRPEMAEAIISGAGKMALIFYNSKHLANLSSAGTEKKELYLMNYQSHILSGRTFKVTTGFFLVASGKA